MSEPQVKTLAPFQIVVAELDRSSNQIAAVLPSHIPTDRFKRILIGAMSQAADVVKAAADSVAGRNNLMREVMKAAQDGIVLDGREGALTTRKKKVKGKGSEPDRWDTEIKYMPMVQGVLKRLRNSGEIVSIECDVVYENDFFDLEKGDDSFLKHKPWYVLDKAEPGNLRLAYVSAKLKDGSRVREVMNRYDMLKVMMASNSKDKDGNPVGPWKQWPEEMWRKSVLHRASKYLPKSSDKDTGESVTRLLDRDAELYGDGQIDDVDPETGEVLDTPQPTQRKPRATREPEKQPAAEVVTKAEAPTQPQRAQPQQARTEEPQRRRGAGAILDNTPPPDDDDGRNSSPPDDDEDLI